MGGYPAQDAQNGRDVTHKDDSDGHAGISFTKLDAAGNDLPGNATNWSCVRDEITGLIWENKTTDGGLRDKHSTYSWYNPDPTNNGGWEGTPDGSDNCYDTARCDTSKFTDSVNVAGLCGASDRRLPTLDEMRSFVDYSRNNPAIDTDYFANIGSVSWYWTSSPLSFWWYWGDPQGPSFPGFGAWSVLFINGNDGDHDKADLYHIRLVRGGQAL